MRARLFGVLAAMLALLAAGLATGTKIDYAVFFALALTVLFSLVSTLWTLLTVRVSMKSGRARVLRGERMMTQITVRHASLLPAGSIRIALDVPGGSGTQEMTVSAPPLTARSFRSGIACPHRGGYDVGVSRVTVEDMFGLFRLSRKPGSRLMRLEVLPRAGETAPLELKASDAGPEFRSRASEDAASPSDIRKWQDGDELKKVHWKLSLRKGELMVRTFEESARPDTLVIPDLTEITALRDQRLTVEDAVCEAALAAAKAQLAAGYPVRMPLQSARPEEPAGRWISDLPGFTEALMRARFDSPYPYEQVLLLMTRRLQRTGGAVLVTSRLTSQAADIAMQMQRQGIAVKFVWIDDAPRTESREMLERIRMSGAQVEQIDPWTESRGKNEPENRT